MYVHIPFCAQRCHYCDFNTYAGRDDEIDAYLEALRTEARTRLDGGGSSTLYVGGGTPTHLGAGPLERILTDLRDAVGEPIEEFTVEANPGSLRAREVAALRRAGVNRVSIGAQTFDAGLLHTLGRVHEASQIARALDAARNGGIDQVSLDLILAIPDQTRAALARDLSRAIALAPDHISAYVLEFEEGTPFGHMVDDGRLPAPDDERELLHLRIAVAQLAAAGFDRYEVSNFAQPGAESRHNLAYWRDRDWTGLGAGAHSHVGTKRWMNHEDPATYVRAIGEHGTAVDRVEASNAPTAMFEALMMGLRLAEGVDLDELAARVGVDLRDSAAHLRALDEHLQAGRVMLDGARLRLTPRGMEVASRVLEDFLPADG